MPRPGWAPVQAYVEAGRTIIGIDEVGRGAWAGPVVAGAVIMVPGSRLAGLNDSKLVSLSRRRELDGLIRAKASGYGLGWVSAAEVDEHGLSWAVAESGRRAITQLWTPDCIVILDGKWNYLRDTHEAATFVKADSRIVPVAAASIIAKVARDQYMARLADTHVGYCFETNVGYGTAAHRRALAELGASPVHRMSYQPLRAYVHD